MDGYSILTTFPDAVPIASDWFEEVGRDNEAVALREGSIDGLGPAEACRTDGVSLGLGLGLGSGLGLSSGSGIGSGWDKGSGSGLGSGWGLGLGLGAGLGAKAGERFHSAYQQIRESDRMNSAVVGQCYLILLPFGLAYVGRFVRPTGLQGGEFEQVFNVYETGNGANWNELARGSAGARARATFKPFDGIATFPMVLAAHPWAGELPTG